MNEFKQMNLEVTILTSLKIAFMYAAMKPDMIFYPLRLFFEWILKPLPIKVQLYLSKPLFDCIVCMGSFWTIVFTLNIFSFSLEYLMFLFQVAGLNYLISTVIRFFHDQAEKDEVYHEELLKKEEEKQNA